MKQSNLQFSNPRIEKIDFKVNNERSSEEMPANIEVTTDIEENEKRAVVKLTVTIGTVEKDEPTTPIYFKGVMLADFMWNEEVKNPEKMLKVSGGTVLFSYMRPILANLTMQAGLKPLHLPFINFAQSSE